MDFSKVLLKIDGTGGFAEGLTDLWAHCHYHGHISRWFYSNCDLDIESDKDRRKLAFETYTFLSLVRATHQWWLYGRRLKILNKGFLYRLINYFIHVIICHIVKLKVCALFQNIEETPLLLNEFLFLPLVSSSTRCWSILTATVARRGYDVTRCAITERVSNR